MIFFYCNTLSPPFPHFHLFLHFHTSSSKNWSDYSILRFKSFLSLNLQIMQLCPAAYLWVCQKMSFVHWNTEDILNSENRNFKFFWCYPQNRPPFLLRAVARLKVLTSFIACMLTSAVDYKNDMDSLTLFSRSQCMD